MYGPPFRSASPPQAFIVELAVSARLFAARADPEKPQNEGWTPLHIASRNGHAQVLAADLNRNFG